MGIFTKLCRNTGLMIHEIAKPVRNQRRKNGKGGGEGGAERREVSRKVEKKKVSPTTTLRRTTIEEVEVKHEEKDDAD